MWFPGIDGSGSGNVAGAGGANSNPGMSVVISSSEPPSGRRRSRVSEEPGCTTHSRSRALTRAPGLKESEVMGKQGKRDRKRRGEPGIWKARFRGHSGTR